jgi:N-acetylneuraminic acid mutarotase
MPPSPGEGNAWDQGKVPIVSTSSSNLVNDSWEEIPFLEFRMGISWVMDPTNGDIYLFGGRTKYYPEMGSGNHRDLWRFNSSSKEWVRVDDGSSRGPSIRSHAAMAYDPSGRKIYVAGGRGWLPPPRVEDCTDIWCYDLDRGEWEELNHDIGVTLADIGYSDGTLYGITTMDLYRPLQLMEYDTGTGQIRWYNPFNPINPTRTSFASTYDPEHARFYIFGGLRYQNGYYLLNDLWVLNTETRSMQKRSSLPDDGRYETDIAYNKNLDAIFMYGGTEQHIDSNKYVQDDLWAYYKTNNTWVRLIANATPGERYHDKVEYDPVNEVFYLYYSRYYGTQGALWSWDPSTGKWYHFDNWTTPPCLRHMTFAAHDSKLIVCGGEDLPFDYLSRDYVQYNLTNGTWVRPSTKSPRHRYLQSTASDIIGGRVFVFGGNHWYNRWSYDLWQYTFGSDDWTQLIEGEESPTIANCSMAYSDHNTSLYIFGGRNVTSGGLISELWRFDLTNRSWELVSSGGPPSRQHATMVYNYRTRSLHLFAGRDDSKVFDDFWSFNISRGQWTKITTGNPWPSARYFHAAEYNPFTDQMLIFGGLNTWDNPQNDLWMYFFSNGSWTRLEAANIPPGRYGHAISLNVQTNELYLFGGCEYEFSVWRIDLLTESVVVEPRLKEAYAREDEPFHLRFNISTGCTNVTWTMDTNATWLQWNETEHSLSGVPTNADVGRFRVSVRASIGYGIYDEVNLTLHIQNAPPVIKTTDIINATEDEEYLVDYDSSDDGQGIITWSLETDASDWLTIDPASGVLNGVPENKHVGTYKVNVSVDDGNGGWAVARFDLQVFDSNDNPVISTGDILYAWRGKPYVVDYDASDVDPTPQTFSWAIETHATFLKMDPENGILSGTPGKEDIGTFMVLVRVEDGHGGSAARSFTLRVQDMPPVIKAIGALSVDEPIVITIKEGRESWLKVVVEDESPGSVAYEVSCDWDGVEARGNGTIYIATGPGDAGEHIVTLAVTDDLGGIDEIMFKISVMDVNDPPVILTDLQDPFEVKEDKPFILELEAFDQESDPITWSDDSYLFEINSIEGTISFVPRQEDVGSHEVTITVSDGRGGETTIHFTLVVANVNDAPVILSIQPPTGTSLSEGVLIAFVAIAMDEDGDELVYTWKEKDMIMGSGAKFTHDGLSSGIHIITLVVDDGTTSVSQELTINVEGTVTGIPGVTAALAVIVVMVVIAFVVYIYIRKKRTRSREH